MNKTPKISIVIPIYKVELYLSQCIESILVQTYTNLEIILIDDGSPDNCGAICDKYAETDNRIIVIHKENNGVSAARNTGIDTATGEYLAFIDSDDWVEPDMIETLYNNLINNDADISCCGHYISYVYLNKILNIDNEIIILDEQQAIELILFNNNEKVTVMPWGKLYKKYIFDEIRYPIGKIHEDEFIIIDMLSKANLIVIDTTPKYYYRQRKSSIMNNSAHNSKRVNDMIEAFEVKLKIIEKKHKNIYNPAKAGLLNVNFYIFEQMLLNDNCQKTFVYNKMLSILRKNYNFMMNNSDYPWNEKVLLTSLKINFKLYKFLLLIVKWKNKKKYRENLLFE